MGSAPQNYCENSMRACMSESYPGTGTEGNSGTGPFVLCVPGASQNRHTVGIQLPLVKEEKE